MTHHYYTNEEWAAYLKARSNHLIEGCLDYLGGKCVKCGSVEGLEFDHINPETKEFPISRARSVSADRLRTELDKCQLLCKPCHKKKHASPHGTVSRYDRYECRCEPCREAKAEKQRRYRANRKR